jgi:hypothetical protein
LGFALALVFEAAFLGAAFFAVAFLVFARAAVANLITSSPLEVAMR